MNAEASLPSLRVEIADSTKDASEWLKTQNKGYDMEIPKKVAAIYSQLPPLECRGLCQECCGPIAVADVELKMIVERIGHHPAPMGRLGRQNSMACMTCPLLKDGQCSIYDIRPFICRLWGVTKSMPCPHGCRPKKWITDEKAHELMSELENISVN